MHHLSGLGLATAGALVCTAASAFQLDGKLPMYPSGRNMNDMPAQAVAAGVPLVLETTDTILTVDAWYKSNAPKCARMAQSRGVKYQCPGSSIMIYAKGTTQIAFVPEFPHF